MFLSLSVLAVALALLSVEAGEPPTQQAVDLDRAGKIQIGDALAGLQARGKWKAKGASDDPRYCEYYEGALLPSGVSMMVEEGRVTRFDLGSDGVGPFGIRIGDTEAATLRKLPHGTTVEQHFYGDQDDHYLTWKQPDGDVAVRVETMDREVTGMYWGSWASVQYVEGCL